METQRIRVLLSYEGTNYKGWQRLAPNFETVQGRIEDTLSSLFNRKTNLLGSGRTDSGVHAEGQVAHFDAPADYQRYQLRYSLRQMLPSDIVVRELWKAPREFHAQFSAVKKTYKYRIVNGEYPSAFWGKFTYWRRRPIDLEFLNKAAEIVIGEQDFASLQTKGSVVSSTIREVLEASWTQRPSGLIEFSVTGTGFLKQMVRNMVGTMLWLEKEGLSHETIREILAAKDRRKAGPTAPAQGLSLSSVEYPQSLDIRCHRL